MDGGKITAKQAFCHAACHCTAAVAAILTEHAIPKDMRLGTAAETNSNLEIAAEEIGEQGLTDQAKSSLLKRIPNVTKVITEKAGQLLTTEKHSDDTEADLPEAESFSLPDDVVLEKASELKALAEKSLQHDNLEDLSFQEGNVDGSECTQDDAEVHLTDEQSNNGGIVMYLSNGWCMVFGIIQDDCELPAKQQRAYKESEREWKASKNPIQCEGNKSAFQNMATHLRLG